MVFPLSFPMILPFLIGYVAWMSIPVCWMAIEPLSDDVQFPEIEMPTVPGKPPSVKIMDEIFDVSTVITFPSCILMTSVDASETPIVARHRMINTKTENAETILSLIPTSDHMHF